MAEALPIEQHEPGDKPMKVYLPDDPRETFTEERVFALCGPMGSPVHEVACKLEELLTSKYGYECEIIKLSDFIKKHCKDIDESSEYHRISSLIAAGNRLRNVNGSDVLAKLTVQRILETRMQDEADQKGKQLRRKCFIVDSIKNQAEFDMLKVVYHELLFFIGVFSTEEARLKALLKKKMSKTDAHKLIADDSGDNATGDDKESGQTVRKTFPQADFFVRIDEFSGQLETKIGRFLNLIFNSIIITPTKDERAMYFAASAAGNSSCLSRQVGACLTDKEGEVLALGWNDVPKYGGGLYPYDADDSQDKKSDARCFCCSGSKCANDENKDNMVHEIVHALQKNGLTQDRDSKSVAKIIRGSKISGLIEYSRAIHAEMVALLSAGHNAGNKIRGGTLYCTTYPCHNCARHMVAAGISKVFYIQPYPKSLALELHGDSISENDNEAEKMKILAFDGIAPKRYLDFFTLKSELRKQMFAGKKVVSVRARPKNDVSLESIKVLESLVVKNLEGSFKDEK